VKIGNHITLLELQSFMRDNGISLRVSFVVSANAWRVTIRKEGTHIERAGIGRTIGEAMKNAFERYTEDVK
jgi:hypothetical protein